MKDLQSTKSRDDLPANFVADTDGHVGTAPPVVNALRHGHSTPSTSRFSNSVSGVGKERRGVSNVVVC